MDSYRVKAWAMQPTFSCISKREDETIDVLIAIKSAESFEISLKRRRASTHSYWEPKAKSATQQKLRRYDNHPRKTSELTETISISLASPAP